MSPFSQIDISRIVNRAAGQAAVTETSVEAVERVTQFRALLTGTLLFLPFLAAYFLACGGR
jgi:hypothetical protein